MSQVEMADQSPDAPPKDMKKDDEGVEEEEKGWLFYFSPESMSILMNRKMLLFSLVGGLYYCIQFVMCCGSTNFYSSAARLNNCTVPAV